MACNNIEVQGIHRQVREVVHHWIRTRNNRGVIEIEVVSILGHARVALRGEPIVGIAPDRIRDLGVERIPAPRRSPSWRCQPAGHAREYETNENCLLKRAPATGPAEGNDDAG